MFISLLGVLSTDGFLMVFFFLMVFTHSEPVPIQQPYTDEFTYLIVERNTFFLIVCSTEAYPYPALILNRMMARF